MSLPDDWICPSSDRCLCSGICEAREAMDEPPADWEWPNQRDRREDVPR